ncbi:MAG: alpha amylase N-terminal ig-like domain-containing protein [Phycisphaeraceae bacterium]
MTSRETQAPLWFVRTALLCLYACLTATACAAQHSGHRFVYRPGPDEPAPNRVHLAGSFNQWSPSATPMNRADDGTWSVTLDLDDGVHHYKFVLDQTRWVNDPASDRDYEVADGHGGVNSAVLIGLDVRKLGPAKPNDVNAEALVHDPAQTADLQVASPRLLAVSARAQQGDAQRVFVLVDDDETPGETMRQIEMAKTQTRLGLDRFHAVVSVTGERVRYRIAFVDGEDRAYLPGKREAFTATMAGGFQTPDWAKHAVWYQVFPERFRNGDPANDPGDFAYENLVPWTSDWWDTLPGEAPGRHNVYLGKGNIWNRRYGGDLQGLRQSLPYLRTLGVNAIYLNPIFEAESMHKYDTADFRHVDDNFGVKRDTPFQGLPGETDDPATWRWTGSDKVFLAFLNEARRQGFKVVIDGVFNHVGVAHPFFQDVLKNGRASRYADWFEITDWGRPEHVGDPRWYGKPGGIQWAGWDQPNGMLPAFKKHPTLGLAEGPRQHIFAITRRWMDPNGDGDPSDGVDGWRLDVPGDIPHPFWIDWRRLVKSINPDAYITGEIWQWAHPWLQGDQFDGVMNYRFASALQDFFIDQQTAIGPTQFGARLNELSYSYPLQVAFVNQNLIDSHDTDRFASMFVNPDRPYDGRNRLQDNGPDYNTRKPDATERARQRHAIAFKMAFVGAPMIYYGSEAGMWSPDDPSNRMPMVWKDLEPYQGAGVAFDHDLYDWYRRCIAIRHTLAALRTGTYRTVLADDRAGVLVFERRLDEQVVYVAINRGNEARSIRVPTDAELDGRTMVDLVSQGDVTAPPDLIARPTIGGLVADASRYRPKGGVLRLSLPAWGTRILVAEDQLPD